jgi:glutamate-1-semialdehyde 2,1-aminomutase
MDLQYNRVGSASTMFFTERSVRDFASAKTSDTGAYARYFHEMLNHGISLPPSQFEADFISMAHSEDDIDTIIEANYRSLESARRT